MDNKAWAQEVAKKIKEKEIEVIKRSVNKVPYIAKNGVFDDHSRHHQYSDAQILADIKAREAKLAQEKAELRAIKTRLAEKYSETLNILGEEEELTEGDCGR